MLAKFYMKSGNIIDVSHVENIELKTHPVTGDYISWSVTWKEGKRPLALLSISLPSLEAVVVFPDKEKE